MSWSLRAACDEDVPVLEKLIPLSVRSLQAPHYSAAQMEAALGPVFGVDRQLIRDGTYLVAVTQARVVGCGGWSRRKSLFGGDGCRSSGEDPLLDPKGDPARIRAFFVDPEFARRGIARAILEACEISIRAAGFGSAELVATLAGEPLYAGSGYTTVERCEILLGGGLGLPVVRMRKQLMAEAHAG